MRSVWCPLGPIRRVYLNGPGGPEGVAVARGQEGRSDAYVRAAWFDLRSGRGRAEEVEAGASLGYGGDSCGYPVRVERGARRCAWALTWAGGRGRAQLCFVLGRALAAVLRGVLGFFMLVLQPALYPKLWRMALRMRAGEVFFARPGTHYCLGNRSS